MTNRSQGTKLYGWYDTPDQPANMPTYNPPLDVPCLFCGNPITEDDVRTHSMLMDGTYRSFFYRTHRTCHEAAGHVERCRIDGVIWDSIQHHGDAR